MANATLHLAAGLMAGMALAAPRALRAVQAREGVALAARDWLLASWAIGGCALVPSFLPYLGLSEWLCRGWWMNVFVLHPLLNRLFPGGTLVGELALMACFAAQYAVLLWALMRVRRWKRQRQKGFVGAPGIASIGE